jgi:hypothetical protein
VHNRHAGLALAVVVAVVLIPAAVVAPMPVVAMGGPEEQSM